MSGGFRTTYGPVQDTGWVDLTNTLAVGAVQYRRKGGSVHVRVVATAATVSGTTYTIVTSGANAIPAIYRPSKNARGACDFSGFPGTLLVQTDGSVAVAQNSGAGRAAIEGAATWPLE
jgi:hypothetical protein